MTTDTRLADLLKIEVPGRAGRAYAVAWQGPRNGMAWSIASKVHATASKAALDVADVNDSPFAPHSRPARLDAVVAPLVREMATAVPRLRQLKDDVATRRRSVKAAPDYDSSKPWQAFFDLEIARAFKTMQSGEKAGLLHQLKAEGFLYPEWTYALLRVPGVVSGLSEQDRYAIEDSARSIVQGYRELSEEMAALNSADRLLREAAVMLQDHARIHPGVLRQVNPGLVDYLQSPDLGRLTWYPGAPVPDVEAPLPQVSSEPATADEAD